MSDDLPENYDIIVIGTGLTESIVAAACARVGKQVLHLDQRDFYGGTWASFPLDGITKHLYPHEEIIEPAVDATSLHGKLHTLNTHLPTISNVSEDWLISDDVPAEDAERRVWTKSELLSNSRKFNLDLAPKILYARGDMVELLIQSGICRYAEFKLVSRMLSWHEETRKYSAVPCSRADVFSSSEITLVEKRILMKVLTSCNEYEKLPEEFIGYEDKTFAEFLDSRQIKGKIRQFILDSVAMTAESTPFPEAARNVQKFLRSLGRYGNSPFLWTLYGSGELPQCFCRLCAVFGGIYCLNRSAEAVVSDENTAQVIGVVSANRILKAPFVVLESNLLSHSTEKLGTSRAIFITDRTIAGTEGDKISLVSLPALTVDGVEFTGIKMLELSSPAMACPKDLYVVHLIGQQRSTAEEDLRPVAEKLFNFGGGEDADVPRVLWSLFFNIADFAIADNCPQGMFPCAPPDWRLDLDHYVTKAKDIFSRIFPDEEFLPRVPDPEDVIIEAIDNNPGSDSA